MHFSIRFAVRAITIAAALTTGSPAHADGSRIGTLSCEVRSGWGFTFGSSKNMRCVFVSANGPEEIYTGSISKFGVDVGYASSTGMIWYVIARSPDLKRGALQGQYATVTGSTMIGVGTEESVLVGGANRSITLQPMSFRGPRQFNFASSIAAMNLNFVRSSKPSHQGGSRSFGAGRGSGWSTLQWFPLPAPAASAHYVVPDRYLSSNKPPKETTLGDVNEKLKQVLDAGGYTESSYLPVSGGFALMTRLERIQKDGHPETNDRFNVSTSLDLTHGFTYLKVFRALFTANEGYYRILVFVVTPKLVPQSPVIVGSHEFSRWFEAGGDVLPDFIAAVPYDASRGYHCTVLIYEFEKAGTQAGAALVRPSPVQGRDHLQFSGMWAALTR